MRSAMGGRHRLQESMRTRGMRGCDELRGDVRECKHRREKRGGDVAESEPGCRLV